jgi:broad specificity phosphatase PhoE
MVVAWVTAIVRMSPAERNGVCGAAMPPRKPFPSAATVATLLGVQGSSSGGSRLAVVRHGRSSHVHSGWITASGFRDWRRAYEEAGIREDECVPDDVAQLANGAGVVLCSDAPRAVASAHLLAPVQNIIISPLLRELELASPRLGRIRLPLAAWAVAVGGRTLLMTMRRRYPSPADAARVEGAAMLINQLAAQHSQIIVVTHASFRRLLCHRLAQAGWRQESVKRSVRHWSAWLLTQTPAQMRT